MSQHIAEVIESCSTEIRAQCRELEVSPPLGSIIRIDSKPVSFALVYQISTQCLDPGRTPTAYGKSLNQLEQEHPEIFELLRTEFKAILIGHEDKGNIFPILPFQPPRIHSFVYLSPAEESSRLTTQPEYLRRLLSASLSSVDELIVTCTRQLLKVHPNKNDFLLAAGKELASLIPEDYERLKSILRRINIENG